MQELKDDYDNATAVGVNDLQSQAGSLTSVHLPPLNLPAQRCAIE